MARDGTNRGGRRVRAGTKPEPSAYLAAQQRDGTQLRADEIYRETWEWLADNGCCDRVPRLWGSCSFPYHHPESPFWALTGVR